MDERLTDTAGILHLHYLVLSQIVKEHFSSSVLFGRHPNSFTPDGDSGSCWKFVGTRGFEPLF